jgi:protein-disulfide isomerase
LTFTFSSGKMVSMPEGKKASDILNIFTKIVPALLVVTVVLAFVVGVLWQKVSSLEKGDKGGSATTQQNAQATPPPTASLGAIKDLFGKDLIKFGDAERKVLFVEMADPSCPYCHVADGSNPELAQSVGDRFKYASKGGSYLPPGSEMEKLVKSGQASYVYIFYPGHGSGEMAMKALYCANEKGKFWEVKDLLMSEKGWEIENGTDVAGTATKGPIVGNDKTKSAELADFLKSAIDPNFLKSCLDSGKYDSRLASDAQLAESLGIQGTPDFYVNASNFPGAYNWTDMKSVVDAVLK